MIPRKYLKKAESDNQTPCKGWAKAFKRMAKNGDDKLLMPDVFEDEKAYNSLNT